MLRKKHAKELAQIAWNTGTYLNGVGNYYIVVPESGCAIVWKINSKNEISNLQVEQIA